MSLIMFGCQCEPARIVPEVRYVTTKIPADHLYIPPQVDPIDTKIATQKTFADWLLRSEERTVILENNLKAIQKLQDELLDVPDAPTPEPLIVPAVL